MKNAIIIFGSSRSDGNTSEYANYLKNKLSCDLVDLSSKNINYYDYNHTNSDDDFIGIAEQIAEKQILIFITPVYWYSMSAIMKTFFDRFTDLTTIRKDLGRKLRGKDIFLLSCSWSKKVVDHFENPFKATAKYFDMNFVEYLPVWSQGNGIPKELLSETDKFIQKIADY